MTLVELRIQPLNNSVLFLKEADIFLSRDYWRIAVDRDISGYYETVSTIKTNLLIVEQQRQEFTSVAELQQIDLFLQTLEFKLRTLNQLLPRLDRRRDLVNLGGTILKTLFGTATVTDVHKLHDVFTELKSRNSDLVHSLANQLTYVKKLDSLSAINTDAITNLSSTVKEKLMNSHDQFRQVPRDLMWLNVTLCAHSEIYMAIRRLEFVLLVLGQKLDDLMAAI